MPTFSDPRLTAIYDQALAHVLDLERDVFESTIRSRISASESPIETLFLVALQAEAHYHDIRITQQKQIGNYRVDVLVEWWDGDMADDPKGEVVIELDGHNFHERTKQQAQRDKARDRWFTNNNYRVVRFTGSEVYADPFKCAREAIDIASTAFYEHQGMRVRT